MIDTLNHYLTAWDLARPQLLATTPTSHIYRVVSGETPVVLKLLTEYGWEEQRGAAALRFWGGHGAIRLYRSDEKAQLLEYAEGDELITLVERGEDEQATRVIAGVLEQLHSIPFDGSGDGLFLLDRWFSELFTQAEADRRAGVESIFVRAAPFARRLLADQREVRVLHGDIHHRNIRQSSRGWLAFDPKGLIGERTYDLANTLCNPFRGHPRHDELVHNETRLLTNAAILADALAIDLPRVLAFTYAYACLSASWSLSIHDQDAAQWALEIAEIVEPHVRAQMG
jgi:streptomycin 6-kinase